jgi:anti-sigma factor RsiW
VNDCVNVEVRDALPDLLHGRLSEIDSATMNAHVESCADCRAELEIMRETILRAPIAPRIDAARIAADIRPYASAVIASKPASIFMRMSAVRVLAAAGLVAIGAWALTVDGWNSAATQKTAATSHAAVPSDAGQSGINASSTEASSGEVSSTAAETQVASISLVGNTSDLSDADLEQLVADLDEMDALPSAEPQSITITGEDPGSDNDSID